MTTVLKDVKKYGNSGGVYLPAEWVGGQVRVELVRKPADPRKDLLALPLEHVVSIILYGSYVRGEMTEGSDIDVLIVTDGHKIDIPKLDGRYEINVRSASQAKALAERDPIFYKAIKDESKALFNHEFLEDLRNVKPKASSAATRLELSESSLNIIKSFMELGSEPSDMAYPLMMRFKEILFIECFFTNSKYTTGLLRKEILAAGISRKDFQSLMSIYRAVRGGREAVEKVSADAITRLAGLLEKKISYVKNRYSKRLHRY